MTFAIHLLFFILFISVYCKLNDPGHILIQELRDFRLCNNGKSQWTDRTKICTHEGYKGVVACDERYIPIEKCQEILIEMSNFTPESLLKEVPTIDSDMKFRRILIRLTVKSKLDTVMFVKLGNDIDRFLLTRPWWYVSKEPYEWNQDHQNNYILIIDRVQHGFEKELRLLSNKQYPTKEGCMKAPMMVGRKDVKNPGWFSVLTFYHEAQVHIPNSIFGIYVSYQNNIKDSPGFITGTDCPMILNKWECAFLKPTNCSYSNIITTCHTNDCVRSIVPETIGFAALFNNATINSDYVPPESVIYKQLITNGKDILIPRSSELQVWLKQYGHLYLQTPMKYIKPYTNQLEWFNMLANEISPFMYLIFRKNYFYRSAIAKLLQHFYESNNIHPTTTTTGDHHRCVAAHMRRGDRVVALTGEKPVNMTEYCHDHHRDTFGCYSIPFASITLKHIIDSAIKLVRPEVKTLYLASDDEPWMIEEIKHIHNIYPQWKIYFLEAPKPNHIENFSEREKYKYMRHKAGTASGTFWWATIQLARQCEGFIGHFGSGATEFFYKMLCEQHQDHENICPPTFDLRNIKELKTHLH